MRTSVRIGCAAMSIAVVVGCRLSKNEQAAADTCRKYGNDSAECKHANLGLFSGDPNLAVSLVQARESAAVGEQVAADLAQRGQQAVEQGIDPCEALRAKVLAEFPGACENGAGKVVENAKYAADDPTTGCLQAIGDWEATRETVPDFLRKCPASP